MYWTLELASYLEDAPWPATKDELIDFSMRTGAPLEVVENLQQLEDDGESLKPSKTFGPITPPRKTSSSTRTSTERGRLSSLSCKRKGGTCVPPHLTLNSNESRRLRLYHTRRPILWFKQCEATVWENQTHACFFRVCARLDALTINAMAPTGAAMCPPCVAQSSGAVLGSAFPRRRGRHAAPSTASTLV